MSDAGGLPKALGEADFIEVWAPNASKVELVQASARDVVPMERDAGGWWRTRVDEPVTDYGFIVDGDDTVCSPTGGRNRQVPGEPLRPLPAQP